MNAQEYDVVIVGAGPTGSTAATLIAQRGHSVLIIERQQFPRLRVGESLLPSSVHIFCDMLGIRDRIHEAGFMFKQGGTFRWGSDSEPWSFSFAQGGSAPGADYAFQVERSKFDTILLDRAREVGADVQMPAEFLSLIHEGERVVGVRYRDTEGVERTVNSKWVVDGTGLGSRMARFVGERTYSPHFKNVSLYGYYQHPPLEMENPGDILCEAFDGGWMWFIPLRPDLASVGVIIAEDRAHELKNREEAMAGYIAACPNLAERLEGGDRVRAEGCSPDNEAHDLCGDGPCHYGHLRIVKEYAYYHDKFWTPGLVLAGDSACFADPVFSGGVHVCQYGALLAARSINTCLAGDMDEEIAFEEYERRYRREYVTFYKFLLAFYDMNQDKDSYFWTARKVMDYDGDASDAFIRLISGSHSDEHTRQDREQMQIGAGMAIEAFFRDGEMFSMDGAASFQVDHDDMKRLENINLPLFKDGLVASDDSLSWRQPHRIEKALSRIMSTETTRKVFHRAHPTLRNVRKKIGAHLN